MIKHAQKRLATTGAFTLVIAIVFVLFGAAFAHAAVEVDHVFPRKANYFLHWSLSDTQARELAKWDLLILDMETQENSRDQLELIRKLNPDVIMLVYITPQEIITTAASSESSLRRKLARGIVPEWYVVDTDGTQLGWWPGTTLLNVTNHAPVYNGNRLNTYIADFVVEELLSTGLWDGVFYDNAWSDVTWATGNQVDLNRDGQTDQDPNTAWRDGLRTLYSTTRERTGNGYIIVGNGTSQAYVDDLNGSMIENFLPHAWTPTMRTYARATATKQQPAVSILNANTGNTGRETDYRHMRFGLGSALMENGFYSFSYGDQNHGQLWWYDEYSINLGQPLGTATPRNGSTAYAADVWSRSFENGIAVVNSTKSTDRVDLGGEYEKIHGSQDTVANNGAIVSELELDAYDGRVLLKTFETLAHVLHTNGHFVRFFRPDGARVRNGFFAFDDAYKGGEQIAKQDMNGDGVEDILVVKGNKMEAWRSDGQPFFKRYPYTAQYTGELRVALGDVTSNRRMEVIVAPAFGDKEALPVRVYTVDGLQLVDEWYPFGRDYKGGYSVAMANVDADPFGEYIIGTGTGTEPRIAVYSHNLELQETWLAFEGAFRGGVNVAAGRIAGSRIGQIAAGRGPGGKPEIRVFDGAGNQQGNPFLAYSALDTPGIDVRIVDIDFDGRGDIVGMSADF